MLIDESAAKGFMAKRAVTVHKGECGRILVVAGSTGLTGAAVLAAQAALRAGAGIVTLACAKSLNSIFEIKLTEVMTVPVDEAAPGIIGGNALGDLLEREKNYDVTLLGPGLGRHEATQELVRAFIEGAQSRLVLDADALYALRGQGGLLKKCSQVPVLTPHLGEMALLLGISVKELRRNIKEIANQAAREYNGIFVVKSEKTIVAFPTGEIMTTGVGNAGMATAGSGDVLAGTIAGAYKLAKTECFPQLGVYIHGRAGDLAFDKVRYGLIASDIMNNIGCVLAELC